MQCEERTGFPWVSVIIPTRNSRDLVVRAVRSALESNYTSTEVIVIDDNSIDGTTETIRRLYGRRLTILEFNRTVGICKALNLGASQAKGKYLVFLDSDAELQRDCLLKLVLIMEKYPRLGSCQPRLLTPSGRIDGTGDFINEYAVGVRRGRDEPDEGNHLVLDEVFSCRGATFIVRADAFAKVGGLDNSFLVGSFCDVDLGWRLRLLGYYNAFVPNAVSKHIGGVFSSKPSPQVIVWRVRNTLGALCKNWNRGVARRVLVRLISYFFDSLGYIFLLRDPRRGVAFCRGLLFFLRDIRNVWMKRLETEAIRIIDDAAMLEAIHRLGMKSSLPKLLMRRLMWARYLIRWAWLEKTPGDDLYNASTRLRQAELETRI